MTRYTPRFVVAPSLLRRGRSSPRLGVGALLALRCRRITAAPYIRLLAVPGRHPSLRLASPSSYQPLIPARAVQERVRNSISPSYWFVPKHCLRPYQVDRCGESIVQASCGALSQAYMTRPLFYHTRASTLTSAGTSSCPSPREAPTPRSETPSWPRPGRSRVRAGSPLSLANSSYWLVAALATPRCLKLRRRSVSRNAASKCAAPAVLAHFAEPQPF